LGVKFVAAKRRVLVGFHERAATYITEMAHCPILMPPMNALLGELADAIARSSLRERLPQIEVAVGDDSAALVLRVLAPPTADDRQLFLELGRRHAIDIYVQPGGPGTVAPLAGETRPLRYGLPEFGVTLEFSPTDFVQINAHVNARLVSAAVEAADLRTGDRVLDLFCGLGNFSLPFARHAEIVLGVEGDAGLVARAVRNAALNGIRNARFLAADLAESEWSFLRESWDVVVIDPPRTGAEAVIAQMVDVEPRKIVYVSCHPATLARDAKLLADRHSYRLLSARVFDMFPHTHHVEVMAVFGRG
jgi:23S rRNA (uracil1939-C5)-methyltransferase